MTVCPTCSHVNPDGAKFCSECGTDLEDVVPLAQEERKVVTVLFADLVGFTSRAEQMDPEDVRAFLSPYYRRLRDELERFGGTVEKFIGDAVMALFGAPVSHEDDPERAVRAALAIRDWVRDEERIQVRIALTTGEALVVLGARPVEGEAMAAGDVVNTASRLQSAAPVNGILVGERTFRATRQMIDYREASPVAAKGKAQPVAVWEALAARVPVGGDIREVVVTPLVGRQQELALLADGLVRLRTRRSPQLITVIGVPGIGKTRLLAELSAMVDAETHPVTWLAGRSRPYDSAVSFDALAEMVKAQASILETDSPQQADDKLTRTAAEVVPAAADWVRRHLSVLVGGAALGLGPAGESRPEETFGVWRSFFEALAERQPLVLVFEDLHWADEGLLDFIDYLIEWATDVPVLIVCSARPELLERRPGWGGGKANAATLSLAPLSDDDTARLIGLLVGRPLVEADRPTELLARTGGNPLYAEQYVQMLGDHRPGEELPPPESIQALIAARLDALTPSEKRVVQDAAVIGKVFWPDAIRAISDAVEPASQEDDSPLTQLTQLEDSLHRLERKQFVRRDRASAVAGQRQYAFLHILLREVAYGQIPRTARIYMHLRTAQWFEALGRPDEQAEMLARHYLAALELARAANQDTAGFAPRARTALRAAGDRAQKLNGFGAAAGFYRSAVGLWPDDGVAERTDLLFRLAVALFRAGDDSREQALETALAALLAAGDRTRAAVMESDLGEVWFVRGDRDRSSQHLARASELVRQEPASPEKVEVLAMIAQYQMLAMDFDADSARQALQLAEQLGLDEQRAELLITIGAARWFSGDRGGSQDTRRALEIASAGDYLLTTRRAYINLGASAEKDGDLREALRLTHEAEAIDQKLGSRDDVRWDQATAVELLFELGEWERSAAGAENLVAESERRAPHYLDTWVRLPAARLRLASDEIRGALEDQAAGLAAARLAKDPQILLPALAVSACLLSGTGQPEQAKKLLDELVEKEPRRVGDLLVGTFLDVALAADRLGRTVEIRKWIAASGQSRWSQAACALLDHDFEQALAVLEDMGAVRGLNLTRLWVARVFAEGGRRAEVDATLEPALNFFRSVGAKRFIREAEALSVASS